MPRQARQQSETGIYHTLQRGINQQDIFQDDEDRCAYLKRLTNYKNECAFEIYAYCLMDNHVHLLLKVGAVSISDVMRKISGSYVYWYNWKYNRTGHLFQDRYKSEPVEDEKYLLTVLRYIHQNPVKVGFGIDHWTSYNDYLGNGLIADTKPILELFNNNSETARNQFIKYVNEPSNDTCLDVSDNKRVTDEEAKEMAKNLGLSTFPALQQKDKEERDALLRCLKEAGMSVRQLERMSGLGRGIILRS